MFNHVQKDLRELIDLVRQTATWDATLAAKPDIEPSEAAFDERRRQELRIAAIKQQYDL
ncbi:MAG TPA: hypothetical protein VF450_17445 [Noviherbaspirillum sp.]